MRFFRLGVFVGLVVFLVVGVLAGFNYEDNDLIKSYSEGENIKGSFNISFDDEPVNSLFTTNLAGNITLLNFLKNNSMELGSDYNCSTPKCSTDYNPAGDVVQVSLSGEEIVGLRVSGSDITSIESFSFRVTSDLGPSCVTPISVDLLNDQKNVMISNNYQDGSYCGETNYGCFDSGATTANVRISTTAYCNKVTLPRAPGFRLGAKVRNSTNGNSADLKMELYNINGGFVDFCTLPVHTQAEQNLDCLLDYANPVQEDYLVCIKRGSLHGVGEPNYEIKSETEAEVCGTDNLGITFTRDYDLYLKTLRYDSVDFYINNTNYNEQYGENLRSESIGYILDNYNGECGSDCVIPVRFSGPSQTLTFSNVDFSFKDGNTLVSDNKIYDVIVESPVLSSGYLKLDLGKSGLYVPYNTNQKEFRLYLDGDKVFEEDVAITEGINFDISPKFAAFGIPTEFRISLNNNSITSSRWDFGEGYVDSSSGRITHTFTEEGAFDVTVEAKIGNSTGTRTFTILVGDARESARLTIDDYKARVEQIKKDVLTYSTWVGNLIDASVGTQEIEAALNSLEGRYDRAEGDENYTAIMLDLLELDVPKSINSTTGGELPLLIGFDSIDVDYIESLSTRESLDGGKLKEAIGDWMNTNFDGKIEFDYITGSYDDGARTVVSKFKLDLIPVGEPDNSYLIIQKDIADVRFSTTHGERSIEDATYISLDQNRRVVEFAFVGEEYAEDLGIHVSPVISLLDLSDDTPIDEEDEGFNWTLFIIGIIVLLVLAFIGYIIMQEWYKRNYEHHLFNNDNDLYNLINFIYNGRKAGMKDGQIKSKLKQSKWSSEQIGYAIRKLDGKRTGMWEIPLFKGRENKKVREEIQKRQNPRFAY